MPNPGRAIGVSGVIFLTATRARRARLDEESALRDAYRLHGAELYRFALRALRDPGAAEEVVQDTFLRAWRAAERFDPDVGSLRVWLFAIARNLTRDALRARAVRPWGRVAQDDGMQAAPDPSATDEIDRVLSAWVLEEAFRTISDEHRHAVVEVHFRGRTPAEVAVEAAVPAATIRTRLYYGLRALRSAMQDLGVTQ